MFSLGIGEKRREDKQAARIKELESEIIKLKQDLIHDSLTGLKTRKFFEQEAGIYLNAVIHSHHIIQRREWFGFKRLSFVFFDIDHFKKINDTYGHKIGDEVLKAVARVIMDSVREGDIVARWGGEEMTLLFVGGGENEAFKKTEEIRKKVEEVRFEKYPDLRVTISAGIATTLDSMDYDEVMKFADKAMYEAKKSGRNRIKLYSGLE